MKRIVILSAGLALIVLVGYTFAYQSIQGTDRIGNGLMSGDTGQPWFDRHWNGEMGQWNMRSNSHAMRMGQMRALHSGTMMGVPDNGLGSGHIGDNFMMGASDEFDGACWNLGAQTPSLTNSPGSDQITGSFQGDRKVWADSNLKIDAIRELDGNFEAEIVNRDGVIVDKLLINRNTGELLPNYRATSLDKEQTQALTECPVITTHSNLKLGNIEETQRGFEVEVQNKDNDTVGTLLIDPNIGWVQDAR